ncbi:efflux RND transporter periplasmic adaptor subunit [Actibacterium lipolyticum]|uniref:Multidrug resistance protein MdtA n=1 Tax=Actibacterium lipolyticum TaxID=1524263 RepID=A0A238KQ28_9RHOB|nr:efflux RND transporter periplasmic adaptor subunit [Actibacterium lipolyticum]SMX44895.1 Multidrug resistance protein MdtA precursor [Actibacterium lipolyticum]
MRLFPYIAAVCLLAFTAQAEEPLAVRIVTATPKVESLSFSLTGEILAREEVTVSFPVGGRVVSVLVEEGDVVAKGAALAHMESVQQEQALRAAEAGLSTADADFRQASEAFERQVALLARGATTRISRDAAEDALSIAQGTLAQAQADLERAHKALADTTLLAPEDATVTSRDVELGQVVGAAQSVLTLALGSALDAVFNVPEALPTTGAVNGFVALSLIDRDSDLFSGVIRETSPLVDPATGTVLVTVGVSDAPANVSYGDPVRGTVRMDDAPHITLPYTAMSATVDGPAVWVVDPETMQVSIRQVVIDRFETGRIVLNSGLEAGELIVTDGAQLMYPGRVVRSVEVPQ